MSRPKTLGKNVSVGRRTKSNPNEEEHHQEPKAQLAMRNNLTVLVLDFPKSFWNLVDMNIVRVSNHIFYEYIGRAIIFFDPSREEFYSRVL